MVFPDQAEPPAKGSLEELMNNHADVLAVAPNNTVLLQMQDREVDIHPENEEFDIFVTQLLRSLRKYEGRSRSSGLTLRDLEPVTLAESDQNIPQPDLAGLASAYREVLATTDDPAVNLLARHRLADILVQQGEAALSGEDTGDRQAYFAESIPVYEDLLLEHADDHSNDHLLYQLAKAHALSGDSEQALVILERLSSRYPDSPHAPEAEFRRAESFFAAANYSRAELAYTRVVGYGETTPYYLNALYMQGWSRLKEGKYHSAIEPLIATLDHVMPDDGNIEKLPRGERELAQDSLRALAVTFSQLDGARSISQAFDQLGPRAYQPRLYSRLGDLYLEQERYADSADAYKSYMRGLRDSGEASRIQLRIIESYQAGNFPALVAQEKQLYVERFAIGGEYWLHSSETERADSLPNLKQFTEELANYHHALAQREAGPGGQQTTAREYYLAAINYYQSFINSFPRDDRVPALGFLLGECQFEVGDYPGAIRTYEWVAYESGSHDSADSEQAADAAYAALLAYDRLGQDPTAPAAEQRIASERRFAATFAADPRAPAVLEHASAALLLLDEYEQSADAASIVIGWQPPPDAGLLTAARLVLGHSLLELQRYSDAEQAYREALGQMPAEDERYPETGNRLAASVYRQGEVAAEAGDYREAALQFERVIAARPAAPVRINAQFDAAMNYIQAGDLQQANRLLLDFRNRFPEHELAASIGAKLIRNYEQLELWQAAAGELDLIAAEQPQAERERQALYLAADYYDRSGKPELAIQRFQSYVKRWPAPFDMQLEAMYRLSELYQQAGQLAQQRSWLARITAAHDGAGRDQSERSFYLAAISASILADYEYQHFIAIKLGHPIKPSLDRKRTAMERAVAAYLKTEAYGVQQFSTQATYRMGRIYQQLGSDLVNSDRPDDLDELALEQYEVLLEEQAYPFEEKAIAIYETNTRRATEGVYDEWVRKSFSALGELLPARYRKQEKSIGFRGEIY